jgi:hypothetical protein
MAGFDTGATVNQVWQGAKAKYGTPLFWIRYFSQRQGKAESTRARRMPTANAKRSGRATAAALIWVQLATPCNLP